MAGGGELELVKRVYRAFDERDLEGMLEVLHPEVEFWAVTGEEIGLGEPYRGHDGMRRYFADVDAVWDQVRPMPAEYDVRGEWVVVTGRVYARGGGRVVDSSAGWHWLVRDGQILYGRTFRSSDEALRTPLGETGDD